MCISRLVETEFYSVLAIKKRTKELSDTAVKGIGDLFNYHLQTHSYEFAHMTDMHFHKAIEFLKLFKTNLRTLTHYIWLVVTTYPQQWLQQTRCSPKQLKL